MKKAIQVLDTVLLIGIPIYSILAATKELLLDF